MDALTEARQNRFERLTERALDARAHAQHEARIRVQPYVATEHLLLGAIARSDAAAVALLRQVHVAPATLRDDVQRALAGAQRGQVGFGLTPRAKHVLNLAFATADRLGDASVGTEHLLVALAAEGEGDAARVLAVHRLTGGNLLAALALARAADGWRAEV
jgi:ATP-dependent Clp protease ATP-binding subunit ClpC